MGNSNEINTQEVYLILNILSFFYDMIWLTNQMLDVQKWLFEFLLL